MSDCVRIPCRVVFVVSVLLSLTAHSICPAAPAKPKPKAKAKAKPKPESLVYKTVGGNIPVKADVYRPAGDAPRPVIFWIHGGALMLGNRKNVPPQLVALARKENFVLVSIDYRLAPETLLPGIIEDLRDALRWVREDGPALFNADPEKMVVAGASAGGYLSLMSATIADPPPNAIVSYWGYGDITGEWCTTPNAEFGGDRPTPSREEAFAEIGDRPITGTTKEDYGKRSKLFFYMKRTGLWTEIVSGIDPAASRDKLTPFCPLRNLTPDFPPLLLLHGTADPDVAVEESILMHDALGKIGGDVELITVEGGGHGLWGGDKQEIEAAFDRSLEFIRARLTSP